MGMYNNQTRLWDGNKQLLRSQYDTTDVYFLFKLHVCRGSAPAGRKLLDLYLHCLQHSASWVTITGKSVCGDLTPALLFFSQEVAHIPSSHSSLARTSHTHRVPRLRRVIGDPEEEDQVLVSTSKVYHRGKKTIVKLTSSFLKAFRPKKQL